MFGLIFRACSEIWIWLRAPEIMADCVKVLLSLNFLYIICWIHIFGDLFPLICCVTWAVLNRKCSLSSIIISWRHYIIRFFQNRVVFDRITIKLFVVFVYISSQFVLWIAEWWYSRSFYVFKKRIRNFNLRMMDQDNSIKYSALHRLDLVT